MKKLALLTLVAILGAGATTFAATLDPSTGATKIADGQICIVDASGSQNVAGFVRFSKGVYGASALNTTAYSISTGHFNGTKYYGTAYDTTAIYYLLTTNTAGTVASTLPALSASDAATAFAGWSKL